jgi:hypothetical protein
MHSLLMTHDIPAGVHWQGPHTPALHARPARHAFELVHASPTPRPPRPPPSAKVTVPLSPHAAMAMPDANDATLAKRRTRVFMD